MAKHFFSLSSLTPQYQYKGGNRIDANVANFPALKEMAASLLTLEVGGIREPHWHPNANELGYCLEGKAMMTIFSPGGVHNTFTIEPGEITFVPQGSIHHIQNIGTTPFKIILCFNQADPEDLQLSSSIAVMPDHILGATLDLPSSFFQGLHTSVKGMFISESQAVVKSELEWTSNPYKMNLESSFVQIQTRGGWVKLSNGYVLPHLEGLAAYSLNLEPKGAREPHWHPNAAELHYLISGQARITLLSPNDQVDTYNLQPGDLGFMPRGYLHHIENTGNEPCRFIIFFNHTFPSDIGLSGCMGAYSNDVIASLFGVSKDYFDQMPKYQSDLFIVSGGG